MQPFKSLDLADATGAGTEKDLEDCYDRHTLHVTGTTNGPGTSFTVALEGSLDGTTWFQMTSLQALHPNNNQAVFVEHVVRHVRANLTSLGGGTPSLDVTAWVASVKSD